MGIELDDFSVLVHVRVHIGTTCVCGNQAKIIVSDAWGYSVTAYPAQVSWKYDLNENILNIELITPLFLHRL